MRLRLGRIAPYVFALVLLLLSLLPALWMLAASLAPAGVPDIGISLWPDDPQWRNYEAIFQQLPMSRYLRNSLIVTGIAVPTSVFVASLTGFAMAQLSGKRRGRLVVGSVAMLIIPAASVWIFRFQILSWLGLIDSLWALILPAFAGSNPLYVLLFYWTYRRTPVEIVEAARLEGAGPVQAWWRVARPMARPTTAAVTILTMVFYWSDFVGPVLYIFQPRWYTLPIGLQILKQMDVTNWPLLMAGATVMTLPVVLLFLGLQRAFLSDRSLDELSSGD